jgi:hypothetical protein
MAGFLAFAWQRVFPKAYFSDVSVRCTQKAITVAGTAPVLHRIPSLPCPVSPSRMETKGTGITICAAKLQLFRETAKHYGGKK